MKIPPGILDSKGQAAKGLVYLEANEQEVQLQEFGLTVDGNHSTCYVLVAPEDVISANFAINSGVSEEFADLVVDGILRNSWPNTRGAKIFRYGFDRAVYTGVHLGEAKKGKKFSRMKVIERDFSKKIHLIGEPKPSKVGSIEVQIFRKENTQDSTTDSNPNVSQGDITKAGSGSGNGSGDASSEGAMEGDKARLALPNGGGVCQRAPDFKKNSTWQNSTHVDSDAPSFEVGFFEGNMSFQLPSKRVLETHPANYKVWASFTFLLRSTAELRALGFENVPLRGPPAPATNAIQSPAEAQGASKTDNAVLTALPADSEEPLFIPREVFEPIQPVAKPEKAANQNRSKKTIAPEEQATTSTSDQLIPSTTDQLVTSTMKQTTTLKFQDDNAIEGKAFAEDNSAAEKSETKTAPKSKARDERTETKEERIERKKSQSVLPGVKSAPAHQAYVQRAPTEEPEALAVVDGNNTMEITPATEIESGRASIFADDMPGAPASPRASLSQTTSTHASNRSLPPSASTSAQTLLSNSQPRLPSVTGTSLFALSNSKNCAPAYNIPLFSGPLPAHVAQMVSSSISERRSSLLTMASESQSSTPPHRQLQFYSASGSPGFSGTSSPKNGRKAPFSRPISPSSQVNKETNHTSSECNLFSTLSSSRSQINASSSTPMVTFGLEVGDSNSKIQPTSQASETESRSFTRPTTPKPIDAQMDLSSRPVQQDTEMKLITRPSTPAPLAARSGVRAALEQEDVDMFGTTKTSSQRPSEAETEIATQPNEAPLLQASRSSSPSPSEISTIATEVAGEMDLETIRKTSQKESVATSKEHTASKSVTHQSFQHTEESPILGSSQRLIIGRGEGQFAPGGSAQTQLISPPSSAQKRKVANITGEDSTSTTQSRKFPHTRTNFQSRTKGGFLRDTSDPVNEAMTNGNAQIQRVDNEARASIPAAKSEGEEPYWQDDILRQERVAHARKVAAEQQRMELQAQYAAALQMKHERAKVKQLNDEAERMERENAKLQATISRLMNGEDV